jgi:hypothetical protein
LLPSATPGLVVPLSRLAASVVSSCNGKVMMLIPDSLLIVFKDCSIDGDTDTPKDVLFDQTLTQLEYLHI